MRELVVVLAARKSHMVAPDARRRQDRAFLNTVVPQQRR